MGFALHHPLAQHPGAVFGQGHEGVGEAAQAAFGLAGGGVGVAAGVAAAEVAIARVDRALGEDRHHRAVDVAVHHRHHIVVDAVAIAGTLAAHDHLGAHRVGVAGGEGVLSVGLLEAAAHPVDGHFPQLGGDGLVHLRIVDALHLGLEVGTHGEAALHAAVVLLPNAAAAVAAEAGLPGVAVLVGGTERRGGIAAGNQGSGGGGVQGGGGHGGNLGSRRREPYPLQSSEPAGARRRR